MEYSLFCRNCKKPYTVSDEKFKLKFKLPSEFFNKSGSVEISYEKEMELFHLESSKRFCCEECYNELNLSLLRGQYYMELPLSENMTAINEEGQRNKESRVRKVKEYIEYLEGIDL